MAAVHAQNFDLAHTPPLCTDLALVRDYGRQWAEQPYLALDTEFIRTDTYLPKIGLVQVNDGERTVLLDPLAPGVDECLTAVLSNHQQLKIMHASAEDLLVLSQYTGQEIRNIFDSQIAATLAGEVFSISYSKLVEALFDIELPKTSTRSDWLQRPLTAAQRQYAAHDVLFLPQIYELLSQKLAELGRLSWLQHECEQLASSAQRLPDPEQQFRRVKRANQLRSKELKALQKLVAWREQQALQRDRPRSWIVSDAVLWQIARRLPASAAELENIEGLSPAQRRRHEKVFLELVSEVLQAGAASNGAIDENSLPRPLGREFSACSKQLRKTLQAVAAELKLAPEILARKKDLEQIMLTYRDERKVALPQSLGDWRAAVIGEPLLAAMNEQTAKL